MCVCGVCVYIYIYMCGVCIYICPHMRSSPSPPVAGSGPPPNPWGGGAERRRMGPYVKVLYIHTHMLTSSH